MGRPGPGQEPHGSFSTSQGPELLQDLMEDMKILKEAHRKKEQPELQPEVRAAGIPPWEAE